MGFLPETRCARHGDFDAGRALRAESLLRVRGSRPDEAPAQLCSEGVS